jgi:SAM-dependent methyltransferase
MLSQFIDILKRRSRENRAKLFNSCFHITQTHKVLDLGSGDGSYIADVLPFRENVYIADISKEKLELGKLKYGFKTILLNENPELDFPDQCFDIVFCNSAIEHITGPKAFVKSFSTDDFRDFAFRWQKQFANEIRRVSKGYFVQTPNKYFIIESHTLLPFFILYFPRKLLLSMVSFMNKFWLKKTSCDWNLLSLKQMRELFPDATLYYERFFGLKKSIIATRPVSER